MVIGGPGTGKTTVAVETVLARVERDGLDPGAVLVLTATRRAAAALRERITARLGRTVREPVARTPHSYAFGLLRRSLVLRGEPAPRLISGPEQDRILADLLAGHSAGAGFVPQWPQALDENIRALRGFRDELRDLIMRAVERGLSPADLARLGREHARPDWVAACDVYAEYLDVTALSAPGAFDPAGIVEAAAALLADDADLLIAERAQRALVVVDDAQELTTSGARLVAMLGGNGHDLVLLGDPDVATQGFRGARPRLLAEAADRLRSPDGRPARQIVLPTVHRNGPALRAVARRVTGGIASAGLVAHRSAAPAAADERGTGRPVEAAEGRIETLSDGRCEVHLLASAAQEAAFVAQLLRRAHLEQRLPWHRMAVLVRSGAATPRLRRALLAAGVPVAGARHRTAGPGRTRRGAAPPGPALRPRRDPADPRGRDRAAHRADRGRGRDRPAPAAATAQVGRARRRGSPGQRRAPGRDAAPPTAVSSRRRGAAERVAQVLDAGRDAARLPASSAETVLWAIWEATGLGPALAAVAPSAAVPPGPGPTGIWTPWWRCSRRRPRSSTGCPARACRASWTTWRARTCPPTPSPSGHPPRTR